MQQTLKASLRQSWLEKAGILVEALPYMQSYQNKFIIIKLGGQTVLAKKQLQDLAQDIVLLRQIGCYPIVIHGGGSQINKTLTRLDLTSEFIDGVRVTNEATMEVVEMVLASINKHVVAAISQIGGKAVGLSGKDAQTIIAAKLNSNQNLGLVGKPVTINTDLIINLSENKFVPVIAPIACDANGVTLNINADLAAAEIAVALNAGRVFYLSDVSGLLDANQQLIYHVTREKAEAMIADNTVNRGMVPKLRACIDIVSRGIHSAVILDGRVKNIILLELFTDLGAGTLITET